LSERRDSNIGRIVAGRFEIVSLLGMGGYGAVYRALQRPLDRPVALKLMRHADDLAVARFEREARVIAQLRHPNTVRLLDFGAADQGEVFMALELVQGETLRGAIDRDGALPVARAAHIASQVCEALAEAHAAGIVHRDLKPENVMLDRVHGRTDLVRVLDFGIAKLHQEGTATLTATGSVIGTPAYIAPEAWHGRPVDARTDLYALGVVLYEMLAGRLPFDKPSAPAQMLAHLTTKPPRFEALEPPVRVAGAIPDLVYWLLAKEPAERPASAEAVQAALVAFTGGVQPPRPAPEPPVEHPSQTADIVLEPPTPEPGISTDDAYVVPRRGVRPGVLLALVVLIVGGLAAWWSSRPDTPVTAALPDAAAAPVAAVAPDVAVVTKSPDARPPDAAPLPPDAAPLPPDAAPPEKVRRPARRRTPSRRAVAPKRARVLVRSDPPGARIEIAGEYKGQTPRSVVVSEPTRVILRLRGHYQAFVRAEPGKPLPVVKLEPEIGVP